MSNLTIKVNLKKIPGAHYLSLPGKKGPTNCIVMPVEDCNLFVGEKGVYMELNAYEYREQKHADTHYLKPSIPKEKYNLMTKEQQMAIDICGGVAPMKVKEIEPDKSVEFEAPIGEEGSDLPF